MDFFLPPQTHLYLGCDEERGDTQQLQALLPHVLLGEHVAVEEVLGQVGGLPVEAVHLAHLQQRDRSEPGSTLHKPPPRTPPPSPLPHLQQPVKQDGPHLGLQSRLPL